MTNKIKAIFLILMMILTQTCLLESSAQSNFRARLLQESITIRLFGQPINLGPALNVTLSFSDPEVAKLDLSNPTFEGLGVSSLLTESDPETDMITVVWDDYIVNNEVKITAKLAQGIKSGRANIRVKKVETVGGRDITDSIVARVEPQEVVSIELKDSNFLGNVDLASQGELTAPGKAAIAFNMEQRIGNASATLNGSNVDFLDNSTGVAVVDLPAGGGNLDLELVIKSGSTQERVNIGSINVLPPRGPGRRPHLRRATADNNNLGKLRLEGKRFGVLRFGRNNTKVDIVPKKDTSRLNLWKRKANFKLRNSNCIPSGSYVNVSHPAGTDAVKIRAIGNCTN